MKSAMNKMFYYFVLLQLITSAHGIKCFQCNSTEDDATCARGLTTVLSKECLPGEVCVTYQYDVFLDGKEIGTTTSRGCEKNKNYCGTIEDLINILVKPAVVKERQCYLCEEDLCNNSSNVNLAHSVAADFSISSSFDLFMMFYLLYYLFILHND